MEIISYILKNRRWLGAAWFMELFLFGIGGSLMGQVHPMSDQYQMNLFQVNPAVAGTERYAPLVFNTRQQWMGWEGAPTTQNVTFHTRLRSKGIFYTPQGFRNKGKNSFGKIGIGGGFFNYSYGAVGHTGIHLDYSYHLMLDHGRLALGLGPSFSQFRINKFGGLVFPDPNVPDPVMSDSTESVLFIDMSAGMHYYAEEGYAGIASVQLLGSAVRFGDFGFPETEDPSLNPDLARSFYAYGGYFFEPDRDFRIEPMVLFKYNMRSGFRFDLNTTFHIRDVFRVGAGYRWKEGFLVYTGVRLDNLAMNYCFELPLTSRVPTRFTSHMIQVAFSLGQPID